MILTIRLIRFNPESTTYNLLDLPKTSMTTANEITLKTANETTLT